MADTVERLIFDDSQALQVLQRLSKALGDINNQLDETKQAQDDAFSEGAKSIENTNKALDKATPKIAEAGKETGKFKDEMKNLANETGLLGGTFGNIISKLSGVKKSLLTVTSGFKGLRAAIIGTGVGALLIALTSLIAFFTRTKRGADLLSKGMNALGAIFNVLVDRASKLGESLVSAFTKPQEAIAKIGKGLQNFGRFIGKAFTNPKAAIADLAIATQKAVDGTKDLINEIVEETKATNRLTDARNNLRDAEIQLAVRTAETRAEIKKLNKDAEDTTLSFEERARAAEKAGNLERDLLSERIKLAEENVRIIRQQNALGENLIEDEERLKDAVIEVANLRTESLELQTTLQNKLNTIYDQQRAKIEALNKQFEDLNKTLFDSLDEIALEAKDPVSRLEAERDIALQSLEAQKKILIDLAKELGKPVDDIETAFDRLAGAVANDFTQKIGQEIANTTRPDQIEYAGKRIAIPLTEGMRGGIIENKSAIEEALSEVFSTFENILDDPVFQNALAGSQEFFNNFLGLLNQSFDAQIQKSEELLDSIVERRTAIEGELEKELAAQEKGFANNVELKQQELAAVIAEEEKAQKQLADIQAKAAKAQAIQDTVAQAQALVTASANIFKAFSSIPFVGVPLAVAAIGAMFAAFAKAKIDAANATKKLYTGGAVSDYGLVNDRGRSDIPGRGRGHRVEDSNIVLGGREFVSKETVSLEHRDFLNDLNKNESRYKGVNLVNTFNKLRTANVGRINDDFGNNSAVLVASTGMNKEDMREVMKDAISELIESGNKKHTFIPFTKNGKPGYIVKDATGRTVKKVNLD